MCVDTFYHFTWCSHVHHQQHRCDQWPEPYVLLFCTYYDTKQHELSTPCPRQDCQTQWQQQRQQLLQIEQKSQDERNKLFRDALIARKNFNGKMPLALAEAIQENFKGLKGRGEARVMFKVPVQFSDPKNQEQREQIEGLMKDLRQAQERQRQAAELARIVSEANNFGMNHAVDANAFGMNLTAEANNFGTMNAGPNGQNNGDAQGLAGAQDPLGLGDYLGQMPSGYVFPDGMTNPNSQPPNTDDVFQSDRQDSGVGRDPSTGMRGGGSLFHGMRGGGSFIDGLDINPEKYISSEAHIGLHEGHPDHRGYAHPRERTQFHTPVGIARPSGTTMARSTSQISFGRQGGLIRHTSGMAPTAPAALMSTPNQSPAQSFQGSEGSFKWNDMLGNIDPALLSGGVENNAEPNAEVDAAVALQRLGMPEWPSQLLPNDSGENNHHFGTDLDRYRAQLSNYFRSKKNGLG